MGNEVEFEIDQWMVVSSPGGRYLAKFEGAKEAVVAQLNEGDCLVLHGAFDFMAPMRPVQTPDGRMAMQRDPIVTPPDFTLEALPIYVKATAVYFCADMKEKDKSTYKDLVRGGLQTALQARAASAGLHLPGGPAGPGLKGTRG